MNDRARLLVDRLGLKPHPEGGYYREVFRSERFVVPMDHRASRRALTVIYFLLTQGQVSRWHCVLSDEVWCHLEGDPIRILHLETDDERLTAIELGPHAETGRVPVYVIPGGTWQAAEPLGEYGLVCCAVAPGFEFHDFRLAGDDHQIASKIASSYPELSRFL
ncbi:MAG: cupin domain-containing protein [Verrucomicrobiae bacterium]|nr:cupin domain-containing protein [Verrucomicrobiae bacterium]